MAKSTKIIAALGVAGALGIAALPMASYAADKTEIEDTIKVKVADSCTFKTQGNGSDADTTYEAEVINGGEAEFKVGGTAQATHVFNVFCNNFKGYTVTATASGLTADGITGDHSTIDFVAPGAYTTAVASKATAADGKWTAQVTVPGAQEEGYTLADNVKKAGGTGDGIIVTKTAATEAAGKEFTVTYKAFAGQSTQAGTYQGTVTYDLAATN